MIKYRPLPVVQGLARLRVEKPEEYAKSIAEIGASFLGSAMAPLLAGMLQGLEAFALNEIAAGVTPERNIGVLSTVGKIRDGLLALLPDEQKVEGSGILDAQVEEPYLEYPDDFPFRIPYPTSGA